MSRSGVALTLMAMLVLAGRGPERPGFARVKAPSAARRLPAARAAPAACWQANPTVSVAASPAGRA